MKKTLLAMLFGLCFLPLNPARGAALPEDRSAAVVFVYHRVGQDAYPESNLALSAFQEQISEIMNGDYTVMPLPEIIAAQGANKELPPLTIALTFEGGYRSAFENAMPLLIRRKIPFTVFFAAERAAQNTAEYMNWQDLQTLKRYPFISFGLHPASYAPLGGLNASQIHDQITRARVAAREHLQITPNIFAYPGGQITPAARQAVANNGFTAAFGLQSGAAYTGADMMALPRFSITERYGDLERFQLAARALPLPVMDLEPTEPFFGPEVPGVGFTLPQTIGAPGKRLSCFASDNLKAQTQIIGRRVEVRLEDAALEESRVRVNCTLPETGYESDAESKADNDKPRWRWLGILLSNRSLASDLDADSSEDDPEINPQPAPQP